MKYILFICSMFIGFSPLNAQFDLDQFTVKLVPVKYKESYAVAKKLNKDLQENLSTDFNIGWYSNIQVKPIINTGKAHLIEGMDIKVVGSPQIEFVVKDLTTKKENKFLFSKELSAKSTKELGESLVNAFINDSKAHGELIKFIHDFISLQYDGNCTIQFAKIEKLSAMNNYDKALRMTTNMLPSKCGDKALVLQSQLLEKQAKSVCETKIQKAKIMVNSGVFFQMKRAIPLLLSISPEAPCADEALALSKVIGTKMENTKQISSDLNDYQRYYNGNTNGWKMFYLKHLMQK